MLTASTVRQPALPSFITEVLSDLAHQLSAYGLRLQLVSHGGGTVPVPGARGGRAPIEHLLTPAEARIARMAASGSTNRQIAAALGVSAKTVEAHLTRAYRKA